MEDNVKKKKNMHIYGGGFLWASLIAQLVKNPPQCRRLWFDFLGQEDLLEKG